MVEIRDEVAKEMSDLVVYCQPRSKDKDRFGTFHVHTHFIKIALCDSKLNLSLCASYQTLSAIKRSAPLWKTRFLARAGQENSCCITAEP